MLAGGLAWCWLSWAAPAGAYPTPVDFDGSILRWSIGPEDPPITYEVKATETDDAQDYTAAVDEAATLWSSVASSYFRYARAEQGTLAQVTINLARSIDGGAYSAGYAVFDGYQGTVPVHCSIHVVVDRAYSRNSIAKTVLHEMGHCAGLGHTLIPEAIMSYSLDQNAFALDIDDQAAVTRLYPADGSQPGLPPGCAVGSGTGRRGNPQGPTWSWALLLWMPLALAMIGFKDLWSRGRTGRIRTNQLVEEREKADHYPQVGLRMKSQDIRLIKSL